MTYTEWISTHVSTDCRRTCRETTERMQAEFPELRRVRGHYTEATGERHPHWWLETPTGEIIDPTVAQFEHAGVYEDYTGPEPKGKCLNCGELFFESDFNDSTFCSRECADETTRDMNRALTAQP